MNVLKNCTWSVKEELSIEGIQELENENVADNYENGSRDESWMCKFPSNTHETSGGRVSEGFHYTLQEPIETSLQCSQESNLGHLPAPESEISFHLRGFLQDVLEKSQIFQEKVNGNSEILSCNQKISAVGTRVESREMSAMSLNVESQDVERISPKSSSDMHAIQLHNHAIGNTSNSQNIDTEYAMNKCPACGKIIKRSTGFSAHLKLHILQKQPVKCNICKEEFLSMEELSLHKEMCLYTRKEILFLQGTAQNSLNVSQNDKSAQESPHETVQKLGPEIKQVVHHKKFIKTSCSNNRKNRSNNKRNRSSKTSNKTKSNNRSSSKSGNERRKSRSRSADSNRSYGSNNIVEKQDLTTSVCDNDDQSSRTSFIGFKHSTHGNSSVDTGSRQNAFEEKNCMMNVCVHGDRSSETCAERFNQDTDCSLVKDYSTVNMSGGDDLSLEIDFEDFIDSSTIDKQGNGNTKVISSLRQFRYQKPRIVGKDAELNDSIKRDICARKLLSTEMKGQSRENQSTAISYPREINVNCSSTFTECIPKQRVSVKPSETHCDILEGESCIIQEKSLKTCDSQKLPVMNGSTESRKATQSLNTSGKSDAFSSSQNLDSDDISDINMKLISASLKLSEVQPHLKRRLQPFVVLQRLRLSENLGIGTKKSSEGNAEVCSSNSSVHNSPTKKNNVNIWASHHKENNSENSRTISQNIISTTEKTRKNLKDGDIISINHSSNCEDDVQLSQVNRENNDNVMKSIFRESSNDKSISLRNDIIHEIKCKSSGRISLGTLEKQCHLKKCYVKLSRICVEKFSNILEDDRGTEKEAEVSSEFRTKLKLHFRRSSSGWFSVNKVGIDDNDSLRKSSEVSDKTCTPKHDKKRKRKLNLSHDTTRRSPKIPRLNFKNSFVKGNHKEEYVCAPNSSSEAVSKLSSKRTWNQGYLTPTFSVNNFHGFKGECSWCHKLFFDQENFALHLQTHSVGYKCHKCKSEFHFRLEFESHLAKRCC